MSLNPNRVGQSWAFQCGACSPTRPINDAKSFNRRTTPQSQPIPGSSLVRNSGGGYSWQVDDWTRLDRFLILGAEGGTYYITERDCALHQGGWYPRREPHR
ncbi:MAG TPA: hypothetical protein VMS21_13500 [Methylomirabilota bacterium]|nr:hypothetical protein [Methylomirabilota bacterium]